MPLAPPVIDDRRYAQLVEETLARARVHTPEWTNFGQGDPGVTLVQLFSFLAESLLYRANLIPERNRVRFLELLRVPLAPAAAAAGLVTIRNERGAPLTQTVPADLEVRAGAVPFRTQLGVDVLPVEAHVFFKRRVAQPSAELLAYYQLLYASYRAEMPATVDLYQAVALDPRTVESVDLAQDTVDGALWIALVARKGDGVDVARKALASRTLTLGMVPALESATARLVPGGTPEPRGLLRFELPRVSASGGIERSPAGTPTPRYRQLEPRTDADLLSAPGVVQLALPDEAGLRLWEGVDPLEGGVGDMPPTLEDTALAERVVTWLRVRADGAARARIRWAGINTVPVRQIERVVAEPLADGDGTPDQARRLARAPVLPGTVSLATRLGADAPQTWTETDDLAAAPPEVPVADWTLPPGTTAAVLDGAMNVFELDPEAGVLRFGDGLRGRRLPRGARVYASYAYSAGAAGNVPEGAIDGAPQLPSGFVVTNPVRSWGGADAETVDAGEKQIRRYLRHRDRLVSVDDFYSIVCRTPGVQIGRVEVLPAYHPDLGASEPGSAPGAVTVLAIPLLDPGQPDAPRSDRLFLNALCRYLDPRRLVTTELVVRGADYRGIWISVGVEVAAGVSVAEVVENVKARLRALLAPVGPDGCEPPASAGSADGGGSAPPARGWPLRTAVASRVLLAEAARVAGVTAVPGVLLAEGSRAPADAVEMAGLELPRVLGISVVAGEPVPIDALRGTGAPGGGGAGDAETRLLPVPVVPETC